MTNAIKYTYNGTIELCAEIDYEMHNSVKLIIKEAGLGLLKKLKNDFQSVNRSSE